MQKFKLKSTSEIKDMQEGGKLLRIVKNALMDSVKVGVSAKSVDDLADSMINDLGAKPSFKMVRGYRWATCINLNDGVVHGIPHPHIIFKKGDVVSVDVGLFYKGFHSDTSFTVELGADRETKKFINIGQEALHNAISQVKPGARVWDISNAIETTLTKNDLVPIEALVGHGVGKDLHEDPQIPCFVSEPRDKTPVIPEGAVLAIEVMYTKADPDIYIDPEDKWTIRTKDGKMAALFEETVACVKDGFVVLT